MGYSHRKPIKLITEYRERLNTYIIRPHPPSPMAIRLRFIGADWGGKKKEPLMKLSFPASLCLYAIICIASVATADDGPDFPYNPRMVDASSDVFNLLTGSCTRNSKNTITTTCYKIKCYSTEIC